MNKNTARSIAYRAKARDKINTRRRARYAEDPQRELSANKAYRDANREKINAQKRIAKWGFDPDELAEKQNWRCAICSSDLRLLDRKHRHVDHCHETNVVRAVLCQSCNTGLGLFKDDAAVLFKAAEYLTSHGIFK
jgi:hypothetical protein